MTRTCVRALTTMLLTLAVTPLLLGAAAAAEEPAMPALGITPADRSGSWYELELEPGATEHLSVEVANHGEESLDVASYAADVYTLVNGGMGVRLRDEPISGTTEWLEFPSDVVTLAPDQAVRPTATVTVPEDVAPGEYIAALVVENDQPIQSEGQLGVDHVVRQALAVNITVPGPADPTFAIGSAKHKEVGTGSVALLEIENEGNRHLQPAGTITLTDDSGATIETRELAMDILYAGTSTHLEVPVDERLVAGGYTVTAELADPDHDVEAAGTATFEVPPPPVTERSIPGIDQVTQAIEATGLPVWVMLIAAASLIAVGAIIPIVMRRRQPRGRGGVDESASPHGGMLT